MGTLMVNDDTYEVVGGARYSTGAVRPISLDGDHTKTMPTSCYIEATIRIGASQSIVFNPPPAVRLTLDSGRSAYGFDLFDTADGIIRGDARHVRFEGRTVEEGEG